MKLNTESKKLILELKDYLKDNLTSDLAPKILEQIDDINKSIEIEDQSKIKLANENAKILLEPKRKRKAERDKLEEEKKIEKEKLEAQRRIEKYKKEKKDKESKIKNSFKTNYVSIMDAYESDVDKILILKFII